MRSLRALFLMTATSLVACGGFLGFGDDDDETPPPSPTADSGNDNDVVGSDPDPSLDASGGVTIDVIEPVDAGKDVVDQTPIDAGSQVLVWAQFEQALVGQDGADDAQNMEQSKVAAIHDQYGARTLATHPAYVAFAFAAQGQAKVYISFSLKIGVMPAAPGAGILQVSGTGATTFSLVVTDDAVFGLKSGSATAAGGKLQVGVAYRVGVEVDVAATKLRAGFVADVDAGKPTPPFPVEIAWAGAGPVDSMLLGAITNQAGFLLAVDDVLVSTKGFTGP